ncbi:ribosome maturation factor RimP [Sulfurimonas sp. MAG313]|nr:ribosome maturation factor RimP [Sulfurimonas sp. MAG313]MDF1880702.1 ribosome maturation factor RimP [Sulfurimonas sp. MAG313]
MSLESDIKSVVESMDLSLYDIMTVSEGGDTIYRILINSAEGISLDKCGEVTRVLNPLLDVTPPVKGDYRLEVSSPGIERKLKTLKHFSASIGEKVKVVLISNEVLQGPLVKLDGNKITINDEQVGEQTIPFDEVIRAATYFEW